MIKTLNKLMIQLKTGFLEFNSKNLMKVFLATRKNRGINSGVFRALSPSRWYFLQKHAAIHVGRVLNTAMRKSIFVC